MLTCVDLFSGLGGFSQAMVDRGWEVVRVDNDAKFEPDICADVRDLTADDFPGDVDLVVASPPCGCFSVASISSHWTGGKKAYIPKTKNATEAIELVRRTLELIGEMNPRFWVLENPRGVLRKIIGMPKGTITYCQYGERRMKPTDLWGEIPNSFEFKKCKNGMPCHDRAPRGAKTGTQGIKTSEERAKIPYKLSEALADAVERTTLDYHLSRVGASA